MPVGGRFFCTMRAMPGSEHNRIVITSGLTLAEDELRFVTSRSRGPGGQNVNKVESRVTLLFDVGTSPSLSDHQRGTIRKQLANRIDNTGTLKLDCDTERSQAANRRAVIARFRSLVATALRPRRVRRPTRPTRAASERRLKEKSRRSEIKRGRTGHDD
jgi:ribosome-associated protein